MVCSQLSPVSTPLRPLRVIEEAMVSSINAEMPTMALLNNFWQTMTALLACFWRSSSAGALHTYAIHKGAERSVSLGGGFCRSHRRKASSLATADTVI